MEIDTPATATATASDGGDTRGAYLVWEDLTVVLPNFSDGPTKRLLNGLKGFAEPGKIMAIMGPSGSGKSTLLDALAGSFYHSLSLVVLVFLFLQFFIDVNDMLQLLQEPLVNLCQFMNLVDIILWQVHCL